MGANYGRFDSLLQLWLMLNALNHSWFLIFLYVGGGIPMSNLVDERLLRHSTDVSWWISKARWCRTLPSLLANCSPSCSVMVAAQKHSEPSFGDYILSSFLLREKEYFTVAVGLQTFVSNVTNLKVPTSQQVLSSSPFQSVFSSSSYKRTLFQDLQVGGDKGWLSPPPFLILFLKLKDWAYKTANVAKISFSVSNLSTRLEIKHISLYNNTHIRKHF